eukprot:XP_001708572.1 Hypothetical protein GL50803_21426 [Giardia lamblia ATCC 50803]
MMLGILLLNFDKAFMLILGDELQSYVRSSTLLRQAFTRSLLS